MTIHDVLLNAQVNLENTVKFTRHPFANLALAQLSNALRAIEDGKGLDDEYVEAEHD